ncbi:ubiquinol-cytochrome C reductase [Trametes meyenii]|nr:ubiquinol-cytochrome C reductase [Trametes meyenii]
MSLANAFYNTLVRRNSESSAKENAMSNVIYPPAPPLPSSPFSHTGVYVPTIFAGAFAFSIGFDLGVTQFWDTWNKGKQWKDIRAKYVEDA